MRSLSRPRSRAPLLTLAALLLAALPVRPARAADPPSPDTAQSEEKAHAVAHQMLQALGGKAAWDNTHYLRFTFAGARTHVWDKWTGQHRVEGKDKEGHRYVIIENVNSKDGKAWLDGQPVAAESLPIRLKNAYAAWVNDTYWLLMPYKIEDPGVHLSYAGEEAVEGKPCDKLHLHFDHVGLTPGDQYWVWVDKSTHLVDRWAYHLESMAPAEPPTTWDWQGWQPYGKILLAPHRAQVGNDRKLELSDIAVLDTVPEGTFTGP
ncbi:MAG TPA: hypothetical protein VMM92_04000 [Thermoanaerobaculia bacterium]|nr:hypothetical protein [Thermoanaerobaculia bacterium]